MTDKKYVVPQGMIDAALSNHLESNPHWKLGPGAMDTLVEILEVAIRWQSENVPEPTVDELLDMQVSMPSESYHYGKHMAITWASRMYLAPEPVVPEAIKDLLFTFSPITTVAAADKRIEEAYNRGVASARKEMESK